MTPAARTRLIEAHLPLVRSVARRYAVGDEPLDDLVQIGSIGLIKAVDRFDAARGTALEPYAAASIAGEIRHHLRDRCAPVRVPRRLQAEGLRVRPVALEAAGDLGSAADPTAAAHDRIELERALRVLAPRERAILRLHYFGDLSQAQVGARLGLSQVHVCRLLHGALAKLRAELTTNVQVAPAAPRT